VLEHIRYLQYVLRHKWFVFLECCKLGVPWLGIIHDISRFRPSEWFPYVASQPYSRDNKPVEITQRFMIAWNDHQHRNKHHWEYWIHFDYHTHKMAVIEVPDKYRREMVADWRGAGRAKETPDVREWYRRQEIILHPNTREWIEQELGI